MEAFRPVAWEGFLEACRHFLESEGSGDLCYLSAVPEVLSESVEVWVFWEAASVYHLLGEDEVQALELEVPEVDAFPFLLRCPCLSVVDRWELSQCQSVEALVLDSWAQERLQQSNGVTPRHAHSL